MVFENRDERDVWTWCWGSGRQSWGGKWASSMLITPTCVLLTLHAGALRAAVLLAAFVLAAWAVMGGT